MVLQSQEGKEAESKPGMLRGGRGLGLSVGWWQGLGKGATRVKGATAQGTAMARQQGLGCLGVRWGQEIA